MTEENKKIKALDGINLGAIALSLIAFILEVIGGQVLTHPTKIGFNFTELHPLLFVGFILTVAALLVSIVGSVLTEKKELNKFWSSFALYLTIAVVMVAILFVAWTIVWPVLFPVNG